jgi:regulator of RNase E activity RraA
VTIRPGDIVLADESGVCVLAPDEVAEIAARARSMQESEPGVIARLENGEKLGDLNGASALIARALASATPLPRAD